MMTGDWHISLHFTDSNELSEKTVQWKETEVNVIDAGADELKQPFPVSFDQFIASVNQLQGGYAEGDGSFGIVGEGGGWKISGNIFENNQALQYVEVLGSCPHEVFLEFLQRLGAKCNQCLIQNMRGGFIQSVDQFFGQGD